MFDENGEVLFKQINTKSMAESLTYVTCRGAVSNESPGILQMWQHALDEYANDIGRKENSLVVKRNAFGAEHVVRDLTGNNASGVESRSEIFFQAIDSVLFAERYSDKSIRVEEGGSIKDYRYSLLEEGDPEKLNGKDVGRLRENVVEAQINFRGKDTKFNGTSLEVTRNCITLRQRVGEEDKPVLQIIRDGKNSLTQMVVFKETATGSRKVLSVPSKKAFWEIKRGLLWSDVYPYPQSVNAFVTSVDEQKAAGMTEEQEELEQ